MKTGVLSIEKVEKVHKGLQIKGLGVYNRWFKTWDGLTKGGLFGEAGVASSFFQAGVNVTDG